MVPKARKSKCSFCVRRLGNELEWCRGLTTYMCFAIFFAFLTFFMPSQAPSFGDVYQLTTDVEAFLDGHTLSFPSSRINQFGSAEVVRDGMSAVFHQKEGRTQQVHITFDDDRELRLESALENLVVDEHIDRSEFLYIRQSLRALFQDSSLNLEFVVIDRRPKISLSPPWNVAGDVRTAAKTLLLSLGARELSPRETANYERRVFDLELGRGYRIEARSIHYSASSARPFDFSWRGLPSAVPSQPPYVEGTLYSMQGRRSNIVRALILQEVRKRFQECVPDSVG